MALVLFFIECIPAPILCIEFIPTTIPMSSIGEEPAAKRQCTETSEDTPKLPRAVTVRLQNLDPKRDMVIDSPIVMSAQLRQAKVHFRCGSPLLLSMKGGGSMHPTWGVSTSAFKGEAIDIKFSVHPSDAEALHKVHSAMLDDITSDVRIQEFFPANTKSVALLREMVNPTIAAGKPKKEGPGNWPTTLGVKIDKADDLKPDAEGFRLCKIKNEDGEYIDDVFALRGCQWTRVVIEFRCVFFQAGAKGNFGFSKRLRYMQIKTPTSLRYDVASDSDDLGTSIPLCHQ